MFSTLNFQLVISNNNSITTSKNNIKSQSYNFKKIILKYYIRNYIIQLLQYL